MTRAYNTLGELVSFETTSPPHPPALFQRRFARYERCTFHRAMKSIALRLAFAIGLVLARPAWAGADQTITFPPLPSRVHRDPDFRVSASASSGLPVSFTASGDCSVSGSTVHILSAGKCWVTAHQPGDSNFNAAPDVEQRLAIEKAKQRITGSVPEQKTYLDPDFLPEITATSGLPVVFDASGSCAMNESYVRILAAGVCSLTAHQPGDSDFTAARIVDRRFMIAKADQTISFALPSAYFGTVPLLLNAQAFSGLPVGFAATGACQVSGSTLYVVGAGTCTVTATQPGDGNFNAAPPVTQTIEIAGP